MWRSNFLAEGVGWRRPAVKGVRWWSVVPYWNDHWDTTQQILPKLGGGGIWFLCSKLELFFCKKNESNDLEVFQTAWRWRGWQILSCSYSEYHLRKKTIRVGSLKEIHRCFLRSIDWNSYYKCYLVISASKQLLSWESKVPPQGHPPQEIRPY